MSEYKTIQLGVPAWKYGNGMYVLAKPIADFLHLPCCDHWQYVGGYSTGNGYDENKRSTTVNNYMIRGIENGVVLLLKIHFPECDFYVSEYQPEYI